MIAAESTGELDELISIVETIKTLCSIHEEAKSIGKEDDFNMNLIKSYYLTTYLDSGINKDGKINY